MRLNPQTLDIYDIYSLQHFFIFYKLFADGGDNGMQFYNSLNKSIAGASIGRGQQTPLSMLHRATPVSPTFHDTPTLPAYGTATHRATPVRFEDMSAYTVASPQKPGETWGDNQYSNSASYGPQISTAVNTNNSAAPIDVSYGGGYPSYLNDVYLGETDCNGKYSTGSADSGVHSNSPLPRARTPTDFFDHHIPSNEQIGSQHSLNKKIIKNETYV